MKVDVLVVGAGPAGLAAASTAAGLGARFEEIEQGAVLEQQLLATERKGARTGGFVGAALDNRDDRTLVGQRRRGRRCIGLFTRTLCSGRGYGPRRYCDQPVGLPLCRW